MNIVFTLDCNFASHLDTVLKSLCYHHNNINIYVIHDGIPAESLEKLKMHCAKFDNTLYDIQFNINQFSFPTVMSPAHIQSSASLFRLYLHQILPQHIERVIYLDIDLIIHQAIDELWDINLEDSLIAGVSDFFSEYLWEHPFYEKQQYINTGVMLINLNKWRENNIEQYFIEYAAKYGEFFVYGDQDVINFSIPTNLIKLLPVKFNIQVKFIEYLWMEHKEKIKFTPHIIHYIGSNKPWLKEHSANSPRFYNEEYLFYHHLSWDNLRQTDRQTDRQKNITQLPCMSKCG